MFISSDPDHILKCLSPERRAVLVNKLGGVRLRLPLCVTPTIRRRFAGMDDVLRQLMLHAAGERIHVPKHHLSRKAAVSKILALFGAGVPKQGIGLQVGCGYRTVQEVLSASKGTDAFARALRDRVASLTQAGKSPAVIALMSGVTEADVQRVLKIVGLRAPWQGPKVPPKERPPRAERVRQVVPLFKGGSSDLDISEALQLSLSEVHAVLRRAGIDADQLRTSSAPGSMERGPSAALKSLDHPQN